MKEGMFGDYENYATVVHEFGNGEFTSKLPEKYIAELNWQLSVIKSLKNIIHDNPSLLEENDTKLYHMYDLVDFDVPYEVVDDFLATSFEQFIQYGEDRGIEFNVRDGRNSPHYTIGTDFLDNLRAIRGRYVEDITESDIADALFDTVLGGYQNSIYTSDEELDNDIRDELDENYENPDDSDVIEVADELLDGNLELDTDNLKYIVEETVRALDVLNYAEDFKAHQSEIFKNFVDSSI